MVNSCASDITSSNFRIEDKEIHGETKHCRYCGTLLNWLNHKPIEYGTAKFTGAEGGVTDYA